MQAVILHSVSIALLIGILLSISFELLKRYPKYSLLIHIFTSLIWLNLIRMIDFGTVAGVLNTILFLLFILVLCMVSMISMNFIFEKLIKLFTKLNPIE